MADELTFNVDALTPRMLLEFKEKTGQNLMVLMDQDVDLNTAEPEIVAGFIWCAMRMGPNPDATWDDALDTPLASLDFGGEAPEPDPTQASSTAS